MHLFDSLKKRKPKPKPNEALPKRPTNPNIKEKQIIFVDNILFVI